MCMLEKVSELNLMDDVQCIFLQISDPEKCDQMYESLVRINSNVYKEKVRLKRGYKNTALSEHFKRSGLVKSLTVPFSNTI